MFSRILLIAGCMSGMLSSQPKLIIKPFSKELTVRSVSDPEARSLISATLQASLGSESKVLPYSLILTNNTEETIIGYTLHYSSVSKHGEPFTFNRIHYNFGVNSNGIEMPAGSNQLATPISSHRLHAPNQHRSNNSGGGADEPDRWLSSISDQSVIVLSVDLVVLESGKVLGPDDGGTLEGLRGFVSGQSEAITLIRSSLAQNLSTEEIAAELSRRFNEERVKSSRTAMTRASEFRKFASFARRSRDILLDEVSKAERNFKALSLTR